MEKAENIITFENENRTIKVKPSFAKNEVSYDEILSSCPLPFLPLTGFEFAPLATMLKEAESLAERMVIHRSDYSHGWKSITLHGLGAEKTEGMEQYGLDSNNLSLYKWMDFTDSLTPCIRSFFEKSFEYEFYHRVRIMLLEPDGYILPHADMKRFLLDPVNIALNQPQDCHFYFEDFGEVPFRASPFIKLSLEKRHIVVNRSKERRYHIIVHGRPRKPFWEPVIKKSFLKLKEQYRESYGEPR
ncbi:aspartyl/asparaginyl beta-hydroxylase domain-containing protein [bacterium]|nr:aspartyl/asparaginyl beta-hydroxylase domain-containing protein [bacterium]